MTDRKIKYCEFCKDPISKDLPNWGGRLTCDKEECIEKKKEKNRKKQKAYQRKLNALKIRNKSANIKEPLNGKFCVDCGKALRGSFKYRCEKCFSEASNSYYDFNDYHNYRKSSHIGCD